MLMLMECLPEETCETRRGCAAYHRDTSVKLEVYKDSRWYSTETGAC